MSELIKQSFLSFSVNAEIDLSFNHTSKLTEPTVSYMSNICLAPLFLLDRRPLQWLLLLRTAYRFFHSYVFLLVLGPLAVYWSDLFTARKWLLLPIDRSWNDKNDVSQRWRMCSRLTCLLDPKLATPRVSCLVAKLFATSCLVVSDSILL